MSPEVRVALNVSVLLVATYGITTSGLGRPLRTIFMRSIWCYSLLACPYCTGWWVACAVAHYLGGNILLAPLYFMAVPFSQRLLPDFIDGPMAPELSAFADMHTPKRRY